MSRNYFTVKAARDFRNGMFLSSFIARKSCTPGKLKLHPCSGATVARQGLTACLGIGIAILLT